MNDLPKFPQDSTLESLLDGVQNPSVIEVIKQDYEIRKAGLPGLFYKMRNIILDAHGNTDPDFKDKLDSAISNVLSVLNSSRIYDSQFLVQEHITVVKEDPNDHDNFIILGNTRNIHNALTDYWKLVNS